MSLAPSPLAEVPARLHLAADGLLAPAKVNLALHVTGQRADGYHTLSSLVAFADVGDRLNVAAAMDEDALHVHGPFAATLAASLPPGGANILVPALALARRHAGALAHEIGPLRLTLEKNLPVASGIGGGSANAAALLACLARQCPAALPGLAAAALPLGADVPMCLDGRVAVVTGVGEIGETVPDFPTLDAVLVNPGVPVSTPAVFKRLTEKVNPPLPALGRLRGTSDLLAFLSATRNDLEAPALALAAPIGEALAALRSAGAAFARMSGSGATVFGLFANAAKAAEAAAHLAIARPAWWIAPTRLGSAAT